MTAAATLARAIELTGRLVGFDTESQRSNLGLVAAVEAVLREHGVPYVLSPDPTGTKAAVLATVGPMVDGGILLSGHTDVVPVAGQAWTSDPFAMRREGTRLYGRGTCDMKAFGAAALAMIPEWQAANLEKPIHILLSYDEEVTCLGPVELIARMGRDLPRPRAAIVGEPTLMEVADAHKSIATYWTHVHGFEAHSAKPALGCDAVAAACLLVAELGRIGEALLLAGDPSGRFDPGYSSVHVGTILGGTARNIIAKSCAFHWEFRGLPGVPIGTALARFQQAVAAAGLPRLNRFRPEGRIETATEVEIPGLDAEPGSAAETLALKLARRNRTIAVSYATEAGRFQGAGIPTVVCGPGSIDQAHQPDEFIEVGQIEACLLFLRELARELA